MVIITVRAVLRPIELEIKRGAHLEVRDTLA